MNTSKPYLSIENLSVKYSNEERGIKDISFDIQKNSITSIIGTENSEKETLLRSINRMHDLYPNIKMSGAILLDGKNIFNLHPIEVRRRIGMIFEDPVPFPNMSIYKNILAGYTFNKIKLTKEQKDSIVEENLIKTNLWEEVKNNLNDKPMGLHIGQQQRLCIARSIALNPEIILMQNPTKTLCATNINQIENLIFQLKDKHTIIITPSSIAQAGKISDYIIYMEKGKLIECDAANTILINPKNENTEKFITEQTY